MMCYLYLRTLVSYWKILTKTEIINLKCAEEWKVKNYVRNF